MRLTVVFIGIFIALGLGVFASDVSAASEDHQQFYACRDPQLGVKFTCSPDWTVHFSDRADVFVLSDDPAVMLTVVREKSPFISQEQLSAEKLKELGHYAEGFGTEHIRVAGQDAVKAKAFDQQYPEIRLTDVYLLKNGYLYRILFSVSPKERWPEFQFTLRDVLESFQIVD